jgi:oxygen-dependent protoporphyrinogen oxidase
LSAGEIGCLVVGAGAAGLAAALELQRRGVDVRVVDPGDAPGGVMQSASRGGYLFERGPNSLRVHAAARRFLEEHALVGELLPAAPASRLRFLYRGGELVPVPMGPVAFARTPLLTPRGKLRLLGEPFVRRGDGAGESVAEFVARRLGGEAVDALVGPFLTGVYAGDERRLGAEPVFPSLVEMERRGGSIVRGALGSLLRGGRERGLPGSFSARGGLGALAAAMAARLGERLARGARVESLRREAGGFAVEVGARGRSETLRAHAVVLATPADVAASLLRLLDAEAAAALDSIEYAPIVAVPTGVAASPRIEGFGFLVPRGEDLRALGVLFMSRLFPQRAPEGRELLHVMLGGVRWPAAVDLPDDRLAQVVAEDLERSLGASSIEPQAFLRWPRAVPQPGRGHLALVARVRERLRAFPGLALAGAYLDGVSVADTLASGVRAAGEVA